MITFQQTRNIVPCGQLFASVLYGDLLSHKLFVCHSLSWHGSIFFMFSAAVVGTIHCLWEFSRTHCLWELMHSVDLASHNLIIIACFQMHLNSIFRLYFMEWTWVSSIFLLVICLQTYSGHCSGYSVVPLISLTILCTHLMHLCWSCRLWMESAGWKSMRGVLRLELHGHLQPGGEDDRGAPAMLGRPWSRRARTVLTARGHRCTISSVGLCN